jgi:cytochrome c-type biogenesis protein
MNNVTYVLAFAAGVLGFLSPCVVPLIPGYLSFVSGLQLTEMSMEERRRHLGRVLLATSLFVLGFSTIFTALGASASALGSIVLDNRLLLTRLGGAIVIFMGLAVLGIIKVPGLYRERRFQMERRPLGLLGAFPVGMAFGFAWTPCVGPVLTAVLTLAAASQTAAAGALLLFAYSLGLGLPFLITAALMTAAFDTMGWLRRNARSVSTISGVFLLVMGMAMVTDMLFSLNTWILRLVPFRPTI